MLFRKVRDDVKSRTGGQQEPFTGRPKPTCPQQDAPASASTCYEQLIWQVAGEVIFVGLPLLAAVHLRETRMRTYVVAAVLIGAFIAPALALTTGTYYVGLDPTTHTCSVVTKMTTGMKMMGKYKSQEAAEKAMAGMKKCHA
jgi:hypothetical protein